VSAPQPSPQLNININVLPFNQNTEVVI